jgi:multidrug efflux pump subunit AcrA (membrane-fusion protein)
MSTYLRDTTLAEANEEITNSQHVYQADVKAQQAAGNRAEAYRRSWSKVAPTGVEEYSRLAEQKGRDAAEAASQRQQLETARNEIESQLKAIPAVNGTYRVDWFAVEVGQTKEGVPIYDLGLVSADPP